jgi:F0F1-type ATP synthase assembly protein I|tara:strand:+ start:64290 stop:64487 length:198 start_codon:yes stop_codon:yes gene_type:complete
MNNAWFKFFLVGSELACTILAGLFIGDYLDNVFNTQQTFTLSGVVLGSISGFIIMFKILNKFKKG